MFIELYFAMTSVWLGFFYYLFFFVLAVGVLTIVINVEISILCTYVQLCAEDWQWHWPAFHRGGSVALYVALYSVRPAALGAPSRPRRRLRRPLAPSRLRRRAPRRASTPPHAHSCAAARAPPEPPPPRQVGFLSSTLTNLTGFLPVLVYFSYMSIFVSGLYLGMGTVGFGASYVFINAIMRAVKAE
jgi:hypothetical protein